MRLDIAAAGHGIRLREYTTVVGGDDFPKHLLPTGVDHETLLGRIVRQGLEAPEIDEIVIHANSTNAQLFEAHDDISPDATIQTKPFARSMDPFWERLVEDKTRVLGCAGDFYADFSWTDVIEHHERQGLPATFVVGQSVSLDGGAIFDIDEHQHITDLRRGKPDKAEFINVGVYVFDPDTALVEAVRIHLANQDAKDDAVVAQIINLGLAGAYVLPTPPFNVNTPATYDALLEHTRNTVLQA